MTIFYLKLMSAATAVMGTARRARTASADRLSYPQFVGGFGIAARYNPVRLLLAAGAISTFLSSAERTYQFEPVITTITNEFVDGHIYLSMLSLIVFPCFRQSGTV